MWKKKIRWNSLKDFRFTFLFSAHRASSFLSYSTHFSTMLQKSRRGFIKHKHKTVEKSNNNVSIQVYRIRSQFLHAVLRQDMSWYDTATSNDFASRITEYFSQ